MKEWWRVEHIHGNVPSEEVLAATAEIAAVSWADGRLENKWTVIVTSIDRPDEPPRRFTLTSRTTWTAKETP